MLEVDLVASVDSLAAGFSVHKLPSTEECCVITTKTDVRETS